MLTERGVKIAPSTCYAATVRPASARALRDTVVVTGIRRRYAERSQGRGLAGVRTVWHLRRHLHPWWTDASSDHNDTVRAILGRGLLTSVPVGPRSDRCSCWWS